MPNYKIKAFGDEHSERFESFYSLAESLKKVILIASKWSEKGPEPDLLDAMTTSLLSLVPIEPLKHEITRQYVDQILHIVPQVKTLSQLIRVDTSMGAEKLDDANTTLLHNIAGQFEGNDNFLYQYRVLHEGGRDYSAIAKTEHQERDVEDNTDSDSDLPSNGSALN